MNTNIFALAEQFKHDFDSDVLYEVKDVFDFNYMMGVMDEVVNESISVQDALDQVELHRNASLEFVLLRQVHNIRGVSI